MCYARLKVRVLTLKRAEHFQSSEMFDMTLERRRSGPIRQGNPDL